MPRTISEIIDENPIQLFANKVATIDIDVLSENDFIIKYNGEFVDILGLGFDLINEFISCTDLPFVYLQTIKDYINKTEAYCNRVKKENLGIQKASLHFKIFEDRSYDGEIQGRTLDVMYGIILFIQDFIKENDIYLDEYIDYLEKACNDYLTR